MKALFFLPMLILSNLRLMLPRQMFAATYTPASDEMRDAEQEIRNVSRLAAYKAKKLLGE